MWGRCHGLWEHRAFPDSPKQAMAHLWPEGWEGESQAVRMGPGEYSRQREQNLRSLGGELGANHHVSMAGNEEAQAAGRHALGHAASYRTCPGAWLTSGWWRMSSGREVTWQGTERLRYKPVKELRGSCGVLPEGQLGSPPLTADCLRPATPMMCFSGVA